MTATRQPPPSSFVRPDEPHTWFEALETAEERALRAESRAFAWDRFESRRSELDQKGSCRDLMPEFASAGYIGTMVRAQHGGRGLGLSASAVISQSIGAVVPSAATLVALCGVFVAKPLDEFGTSDQVDAYLRPMLAGDITAGLAISEEEAGSDIGGIQTTAVRDGSGWVLSGRKEPVTGGGECDVVLLYAVTAPEAPLAERFTAFVVPSDAPGIGIEVYSAMGMRALPPARLTLDNVRLDDATRLGAVGQGFEIMTFGLAAERIDIASRALGCAMRSFEEARAYAARRHQFGRPLRGFQAVSHKLADMRTVIDAGRLLVLRAARRYDHLLGEHGPTSASEGSLAEAAIAKLFCAEEGFRVCDMAMQILGGRGYEEGTAVEAMFRDCRVFRFGGGTSEIQRHIIQREEFRRMQ